MEKENKTIDYHGFHIYPDKLLGYSMLDRDGVWCCSALDINQLKKIADGIIASDNY